MNLKNAVLSIKEALCRAERPDERFISLIRDKYLWVNGLGGRDDDRLPDEVFRHGVGIVGQLYQLYISPEKDEAFKRLSGGARLDAKHIPAATQLFTPKWIADYMAQNSIGRLAEGIVSDEAFSRLKAKWRYYIQDPLPAVRRGWGLGPMAPAGVQGAEPPAFPPAIRVLDPCMGAGHILLQAFDVLMDIYNEAGYEPGNAARLILEKNLHGLDIDKNVCSIADFALRMKAAEYDDSILDDYLPTNLRYLDDGEIGSLDRGVLAGERFYVVIANPPYMGAANMPVKLAQYIVKHYPEGKADLFAAFILRCMELTREGGFTALITQHAWMFLKSFEKLRLSVLAGEMVNMAHLGSRAFAEITGEVVQTTAFVVKNAPSSGNPAIYVRLVDEGDPAKKEKAFLSGKGRYEAAPDKVAALPGNVLAYWASPGIIEAFANNPPLRAIAKPCQGLATGDNTRFVKLWHEVGRENICFGAGSREEALASGKRWFPYNKGGLSRKWYGNDEYVVDWSNDGCDIINQYKNGRQASRPQNREYYFKSSVTWSKVSSSDIAFRFKPKGFIFDVAGGSMFADEDTLYYLLAFCNSAVAREIAGTISPTMNYEIGHIASFPVKITRFRDEIIELAKRCVELSKRDWDSFETSWGFSVHPMLEYRITGGEGDGRAYVETSYNMWKLKANSAFDELKQAEERINALFAQGYNLDVETRVPDESVCVRRLTDDSPGRKSRYIVTRREAVASFLSYVIGLALGYFDAGAPYSGCAITINNPRFVDDSVGADSISARTGLTPDGTGRYGIGPYDNVDTPIYDPHAVSILKSFLICHYSSSTLAENLRFIALSLSNGKDDTERAIYKYFYSDFYPDHLRAYKNRPIYRLQGDGGTKTLIYVKPQSDIPEKLN